MIWLDVIAEPVDARDFTTDTVRNHVTNATIANGTPNPGAIVKTPSTTQTSVMNIISEASEKPPAASAGVLLISAAA
jgi:hypothetical protein